MLYNSADTTQQNCFPVVEEMFRRRILFSTLKRTLRGGSTHVMLDLTRQVSLAWQAFAFPYQQNYRLEVVPLKVARFFVFPPFLRCVI